ncbi:hypothetical protein LEMLEM_LOCUS8033 [Lemmus lemmus]
MNRTATKVAEGDCHIRLSLRIEDLHDTSSNKATPTPTRSHLIILPLWMAKY